MCIAELCERFAGCLLLSLLVLYLTERLDQTPAKAIRWVGILNAAGYVAALGGGWLVGRVFTALRGAILGASLLAAGFVVLAIDRCPCLAAAVALLTIGSGFFRPAIALLLCRLYTPRDRRRDAGHTWFWTAVNVGGVLAPVAAGALRAAVGWQGAFAAAALSMVACVIVLGAGRRYLRDRCSEKHQDMLPNEKSKVHQGAQLRTLAAASLAAILYAAAYGQIDGTLLLWARDRTDRFVWKHEIPVTWFSSLPALLVLLIGPGLVIIMNKLRSHGREPTLVVKMMLGLVIVGAGYAGMAVGATNGTDHSSNPVWLLWCCITLVIGELLIVPIGLALVTRMFAHRYGAMGGGLWFAVTALGAWIGGELGAWGQARSQGGFFTGLASALVSGVVMVGGIGGGYRLLWAKVQRK